MSTTTTTAAVEGWATRARHALAANTPLTTADLDELTAITRAAQPLQHVLYLHTATPSLRAPVIGYALHEPTADSVTQVDPLAPPPPYPTVHAAILDGWRVIHFPQQNAPFEDREIDLIGSEFILENGRPSMPDATATTPILLSDDQILQFIVYGYLCLQPDVPAATHASICTNLNALTSNPGNGILDAVPQIREVWEHPQIVGALQGLLGRDYSMHAHRHWHTRPPGSGSQGWHQDGTNVRHHQTWSILAMYYPHDVSLEMGPTMVMPGTHLRNAPTDRLASYANFTEQVALAVPAGTVVLAHYDIWHAGSANRTDRPRSMLKFVFDRHSTPTAPTWDHRPDSVAPTLKARVSEQIGGYGYCSDYYKEWELRLHMWRWYLGDHSPVPPGYFKELLA